MNVLQSVIQSVNELFLKEDVSGQTDLLGSNDNLSDTQSNTKVSLKECTLYFFLNVNEH